MGKYDAMLEGLPNVPQESDPNRQTKIEALKVEYNDLTAEALVTLYATVRRQRDALKVQESALQLKLDAVVQLLIDSQDQGSDPAWGAYGAKDNAIRLPNGDVFRLDKEPASTVVDPEAFRLWCLNNGYERVMHVHPGKRESIAAERMLAGDPAPDGITVGVWTKPVFTGAKS